MPSTYSANLRLELQATGENANTWGTKTNNNLNLLGDAISGYLAVTLADGTNALTANDGTADQTRQASLEFKGSLTAPAIAQVAGGIEGRWIVRNSCTGGTVTFRVSGGSGLLLPAGESILLYSDGVSVWSVTPAITSVSATYIYSNKIVTPELSATNANVSISTITNLSAVNVSAATINVTTVSAATLNIATPLSITSGGTGVSVFSSGTVLIGNGATLIQVAPSVTGSVLMSNGVSVSPSFQEQTFTKKSVTSSTFTYGSLVSINHGLGVEPTGVTIVLENVSSEFGWTPGQRVLFASDAMNSNGGIPAGITLQIDTTALRAYIASSRIFVINKNTYSVSEITAANWKLEFKAWA